MYKQYYGMSHNPFEKDLETKYAYVTQDMKAVQGRLEYLKNHPGIGLFTAGPGQGKTFALQLSHAEFIQFTGNPESLTARFFVL